MFNLDPATLIARSIVLVIAFTFHEFAHAWTATYFGDDTPRLYGRLTLNPLVHLDPMGSLVLLVAGFGWAKPVPVNPYRLQQRSSSAFMWVSLAGPLSNLLLAALGAILFRIGIVSVYEGFASGHTFFPSFSQIAVEFVYINIILLVFNLIPIAPLDGEKVAMHFFPPSWKNFMDTIRPYGPMIILLVAFVGPLIGFDVLGYILGPPVNWLFKVLVGI